MSGTERKRLHPHKFTLWLGIGSIVMMFAGLTSAVIVKRNQADWVDIPMPRIFWYSTLVILVSSLTIQMSIRAFKERNMRSYRSLITLTAVLGLVFITMQLKGFSEIWALNVHFTNSVGGSFLYIIFGLHALHLLGGIICLLVLFARAYSSRSRNYSATPIEIVSVYWHFVDVLWIYLFLFFLYIQ
jgi:cytochrome c oxidase subunit III